MNKILLPMPTSLLFHSFGVGFLWGLRLLFLFPMFTCNVTMKNVLSRPWTHPIPTNMRYDKVNSLHSCFIFHSEMHAHRQWNLSYWHVNLSLMDHYENSPGWIEKVKVIGEPHFICEEGVTSLSCKLLLFAKILSTRKKKSDHMSRKMWQMCIR